MEGRTWEANANLKQLRAHLEQLHTAAISARKNETRLQFAQAEAKAQATELASLSPSLSQEKAHTLELAKVAQLHRQEGTSRQVCSALND